MTASSQKIRKLMRKYIELK
ncbi:MAG: hypothetical protein ACFHVJ_14110 [Aestuariibacter sp.]